MDDARPVAATVRTLSRGGYDPAHWGTSGNTD